MGTSSPAAMSTRECLEHAARQTFEQRGFERTHVTEIVRRAGVSLASFYSHLESKERAFRLVMGSAPPIPVAGPPSERGRKTRAAIIKAAHRCIVRDGFVGARIADIADTAGVSLPTFYSHFDSKREVFEAVLAEVTTELRGLSAPARDRRPARETRRTVANRIREVIGHYLESYSRHHKLVLRIDEAVAVHPDLLPLRLAAHQTFAARIARSLERWQAMGLADPQLDAAHTGDALAAMVGHSARVWLAFGKAHDRERAVETLVTIWLKTILRSGKS